MVNDDEFCMILYDFVRFQSVFWSFWSFLRPFMDPLGLQLSRRPLSHLSGRGSLALRDEAALRLGLAAACSAVW